MKQRLFAIEDQLKRFQDSDHNEVSSVAQYALCYLFNKQSRNNEIYCGRQRNVRQAHTFVMRYKLEECPSITRDISKQLPH